MNGMPANQPVTAICTYTVKPEAREKLARLLAKHWPTLHELGLVTDEPVTHLRAMPRGGKANEEDRVWVEIFRWKDDAAPALAHRQPQVLALWEPMEGCCDSLEIRHFVQREEV